jgi:hypothetical protein
MEQKITDLDLITKEEMNNNNLLFIQDISESETKNVVISDLTQYTISSSNILSSLRSGSFTGSFSGIISGSCPSSSYCDTASYAQTTFLLNYIPEISNGSSSYSVYSLSSSLSVSSSFNESASFSFTSSYSDKTSYVSVLTANTSSTSLTASNVNYSSYSNTALFLNYNGVDNGTCLRSIIAENANNSSIVKNIRPNNISTSSLAISSSYALFAEKSFYIQQTDYSKNSAKSQYTSKNVYAYINFQVTGFNTDGEYSWDIYSWKNINTTTPIKWKQTGPFGQFYIYFDKPLDVTIPQSTTTVVSDWDFDTSRFVVDNHIFKSYSFPNKHLGMVVGIWSVTTQIVSDPTADRYMKGQNNDPSNMLIGSTFSVVAYKSTQNFPSEKPRLVTSDSVISIGGCAAL